MFLSEAGAFGGDGVADAAVDPGGIIGLVGNIDGDSLFVGGDIVRTPGGLNVVAEQGGAIPRGFFLDESEASAVGTVENHGELAVFGDDVRKGVVHRDVRGVGGFNAGLHGGDADGDVGDVAADEVDEGSETSGSTGEGKDEALGAAGFAAFDGLSGGFAHSGD